jgi:hypothetical protein
VSLRKYRDSVVASQGPRVGRDAAVHQYRNVVALGVAVVMTPISFLLIVIGVRIQSWPLKVAGFAFALSALVGLIYAARELHSYYGSASQHLGVRVSPRNGVPRRDEQYRFWCERNGIDPYDS